jgi:hypothetical protein
MLYVLQHWRNVAAENNEIGDAGYVPCYISENLEAAQKMAEEVTRDIGGTGLDHWNESIWPEHVRSWMDSYKHPNGMWCTWRITELPLNQFLLGYKDGNW